MRSRSAWPTPVPSQSSADREGAHLAEVLPDDVQGAAADRGRHRRLGDAELLHRLVEHDEVLAEEDASLHERFDELLDATARRSCGRGAR